jgi:hypothetical protein
MFGRQFQQSHAACAACGDRASGAASLIARVAS